MSAISGINAHLTALPLILTLTCFLTCKIELIMSVPVGLPEMDLDGAQGSLMDGAETAAGQPKVMDTGVEFLVDYDKAAIKPDYTIADSQDPRPTSTAADLRRNKKSRFTGSTSQDAVMESGDGTEGTSELASLSNENGEQIVRLARPPLVRQDAFDMDDGDDVEESELRQIQNSIDRILQQKKRTKRARVALITADEDDEDAFDYPIGAPSRIIRAADVDDNAAEENNSGQFDLNDDNGMEDVSVPNQYVTDPIRILRPKTLQEARALVESDTAASLGSPGPSPATPETVTFFVPDYQNESDDEEARNFATDLESDAANGQFPAYDLLEPDVQPYLSRRIQKRFIPQDAPYYDIDQDDDNQPQTYRQYPSREISRNYLPSQYMIMDDDADDQNGEARFEDEDGDEPVFLPRRGRRNLPSRSSFQRAREEESDDDDEKRLKQMEDEARREDWLDRRQKLFDEAVLASTLASLLEQPSPDDNVAPPIAGRFRVCDMVKQTFHRQLFFTGKTLEVDECFVTCERKEEERIFSHIFKLVDWPCGTRLEGKCLRDGSCSAFF